jgi:hypothetical protein
MNKPKLSEKKNLRRNLFYGIYFNKFHTICKEKYRISNILMAKEVNKEVKKAVAASVPNHEIL